MARLPTVRPRRRPVALRLLAGLPARPSATAARSPGWVLRSSRAPSPWSLASLGLVGHAQIQAGSGTIISLMGSAASNIPPAVTSSLQSAGTMFAALTVLWAAAIVPGPVSMCALVLE